METWILCYRTTPHSTTVLSPAELLMGRKPRSHLDLLQTDLSSKVVEKQAAQKKGHDQQAKERVFQKDDPVHAHNFGDGPRWVPGVIIAVNGPCMFEIKLDDGRTVRRHLNQVRLRTNTTCEQFDEPLPINLPSLPVEEQEAPEVTQSETNSLPVSPVCLPIILTSFSIIIYNYYIISIAL